MAEEKDRECTEAIVAEFHKKIKDAFEVFDHETNNTVDVREIGTIIRSLGCCPTEGELHDFIAEVEEEEPTGYIRFEKFLPVMTRALLERKYRPIAEDVLLRAFEVLDPAKRGFLTKEELVKYMTEEGESGVYNVSQAGIKLKAILLLQSPRWDYRWEPPFVASEDRVSLFLKRKWKKCCLLQLIQNQMPSITGTT